MVGLGHSCFYDGVIFLGTNDLDSSCACRIQVGCWSGTTRLKYSSWQWRSGNGGEDGGLC